MTRSVILQLRRDEGHCTYRYRQCGIYVYYYYIRRGELLLVSTSSLWPRWELVEGGVCCAVKLEEACANQLSLLSPTSSNTSREIHGQRRLARKHQNEISFEWNFVTESSA